MCGHFMLKEEFFMEALYVFQNEDNFYDSDYAQLKN
jgi:hypothetical protein